MHAASVDEEFQQTVSINGDWLVGFGYRPTLLKLSSREILLHQHVKNELYDKYESLRHIYSTSSMWQWQWAIFMSTSLTKLVNRRRHNAWGRSSCDGDGVDCELVGQNQNICRSLVVLLYLYYLFDLAYPRPYAMLMALLQHFVAE